MLDSIARFFRIFAGVLLIAPILGEYISPELDTSSPFWELKMTWKICKMAQEKDGRR